MVWKIKNSRLKLTTIKIIAFYDTNTTAITRTFLLEFGISNLTFPKNILF